MRKTIKTMIAVIAVSMVFSSCEKSDSGILNDVNLDKTPSAQDSMLDLMLKASVNEDVVKTMNEVAIASSIIGLDESIYLDEVMAEENPTTKSSVTSNNKIIKDFILDNITSNKTKSTEDVTMVINNIEIYWPYSEDWDGVSQPVVVINKNSDEQFIEADKVYAYKLTPNQGGTGYDVETIIVDEEYALKNPVWVINESDVTLEEITNLKNGKFSENSYLPRTKSSDMVCELNATKITSTEQHDVWINGASDYQIYWAHEDYSYADSIRVNTSGKIKITRKQIRNATPVNITFTGNYDWSVDQRYNRLTVIEIDAGGGNKEIPITLSAEIKGVKVSLSTTIPIKGNNDMIMNYHIQRQAMFTENTYVNDKLYKKSFNGNGVTVETSLTCSKSLPEVQ